MSARLDRHAFALCFAGLALLAGLSLSLLPAHQAARSFDSPQVLLAIFPLGTPARTSHDAIREGGALPRRAFLGGIIVSFIAWQPDQVERLERHGAFVMALPSRLDFALGCSLSASP